MTVKRRSLVVALIAAACVIAAAVAGIIARLQHGPPGVPPKMVPAAWAEYRTSLGHTRHQDKVTCTDCHDYEREGFKNPGVAPCGRCHAKEAGRFHTGSDTKKTDCLTCHVFGPKQEPPKCIGCHAEPEGHFAAITTHATTECSKCHSPHGQPSIATGDCAGCHKELAPKHAEHAGSKGCTDCHVPHAPAASAIQECSTCHKEPAGPKPAGHDSCIGCHKPHDFVAGGASGCMGCHGVKETFLAATVPAHAVCTSCHAPHAPAAAAGSCIRCHSNIQVRHADKTACVACHEPHAGDLNAKASPCTSCHGKIAAADKGTHAAGTSCTSCHKTHDFDAPKNKLVLCASCHAPEANLVSTNRGHIDCAACHGASTHKPTAAPPCATCHAKEQASAPKGHQACLRCHEPHRGSRLPAAASCTSCHANKTHALHDAVKGGCETCHRPHGPGGVPSPPACTTCHQRDQLPALHLVSAHSTCATCHSSHEAPRSDRATCTGPCHTDHRDHQPQIQVCKGCHVFRR
jgi:hypothetical protein